MQDIREKLIDLLTGYSLDTYEDVQYVADELISKSVVPVVRCKDCKHCDFHEFQHSVCWKRNNMVSKDGFCSYGERKDGD